MNLTAEQQRVRDQAREEGRIAQLEQAREAAPQGLESLRLELETAPFWEAFIRSSC